MSPFLASASSFHAEDSSPHDWDKVMGGVRWVLLASGRVTDPAWSLVLASVPLHLLLVSLAFGYKCVSGSGAPSEASGLGTHTWGHLIPHPGLALG